jgi:hypothetical protein
MCYARPMVLGRVLLGVLCGLSLITSTARADDPASARIGRLSAVSRAVQYHSPVGDWSAALVNEPVAAGVGVRSPRGATAALDIGDSRLALDGASELQILRLDGDAVQVALSQGRMFLHLAGGSLAKTIEIDLPGGGVWLAAPGDYDIVAGDAHNPARVKVFAGQAAPGGGLEDSVIAAAPPDAFDAAWRGGSDAGDDTAHTPLGVTGAETLAANGEWASDSTYGDVWYPKDLPVDWMPYRYGSWRYLAPWGWTWIDAADWGFAPSHYGAWVRLDGRWAWAPGPSKDEPAYSPAVVGFLGTAGIGLSRPGNDGAAVAWFPLAPGESVDEGNAVSSVNRRAASIVPRALFAGGKPVPAGLLEFPEWRLDDAPVILGALNIPPVGDGGTGFVAGADPAPVVAERVAVVTPVEKPASHLTPQARGRPLLIAHIHNILMRAAGKRSPPAAASASHRWRAAAASLAGPHPAPSTIATASTHNRPHLAAARGGAQYR